MKRRKGQVVFIRILCRTNDCADALIASLTACQYVNFIHTLLFPLHKNTMKNDQNHVMAIKGSHITIVNTFISAASLNHIAYLPPQINILYTTFLCQVDLFNMTLSIGQSTQMIISTWAL